MGKSGLLYIGHDGEKVLSAQETQHQIDEAKKLELDLWDGDNKLDWSMFDNPKEPRTLFQYVLSDRKIRVDQDTVMADRPPIAVLTALGGKVVRLEFYQGHDSLKLVYDIRSKDLQGIDLPKWMERDPHAYNPFKFLRDIGIPIPMELIDSKEEENKST